MWMATSALEKSYDRIIFVYTNNLPVPVAVRSKASVYGRSLAGIAGSNPTEGVSVRLLSGRSLCDGPIPRPEASYRLCCVTERDLGNRK
jgi:hypothetical protein